MYFESVDIRPFSIRKQIFSEYKLPDDPVKIVQRMQISKDKKSSNQILLKQLGLFKFNLISVLFQKNDLLKKLQIFDQNIRKVYNFIADYNEGDFTNSEQIELKFKSIEYVRRQTEIIQNARLSSSIRKSKLQAQRLGQTQYLMKALIIYKSLLNYGQSLKFDSSTFRLGTLSNFNPKYTQVKFTKKPQQSENFVMRYVNRIIEQSSKAMESKVRYENNYEKDRFLLEQDKYANSWKSLEELYSPKQVQMINFEMLNILNAFDEEFEKFKVRLRSHGDNCKKYQGVLDSMDLMCRQTQQMVHTIANRDKIISTLVNLSSSAPEQMQRILSKCQQQQTIIQQNIKRYHINEKLFASYNTQTNLNIYSKQRNIYSIKLNQLQQRMSRWKVEYGSVKEIVQGFGWVDDVVDKKNVGRKIIGRNSAEVDKRMLKIEEVNTRRNQQIAMLKTNVLQNLKQKLQNPAESKVRVVSARRISSQAQQFPNNDDDILQTQKSFISTLHRTPNSQRKLLLLQYHQKIKQYIEYNHRKSVDNKIRSQLIQKLKEFQFRFSILDEIAKVYKQLSNKQISKQSLDQQQQRSFDSIVKEHLKTIRNILFESEFKSKRFVVDEVVYQHVYDYSLFSQFFNSQHWLQMNSTLQKLQGSFISRPVSFTSHDSVKALKQLISFTKQFVKQKYPQLTLNMLHIFSSTLFNLTNGISTELYNFQDFYWGKMTRTVTIFYERNNYKFQESAYNSKTIDKSSFFSLPYLIHLNRTSNKYKVLNLDVILIKIVKMIYDQFTNYRQYEIFQNAICLTYLMKYIRNVCHQNEVQQKLEILLKLRRLLTSQLLKWQFMRNYEIQKKQQIQISNKMIENILGLHGYIAFTNVLGLKKEKLTQFEIENNKYLKGIEQDIKPLVINLSVYTADLTLQRIKLIWGFEEWPYHISKIIEDSESLSSILMFSCFSIYKQNIESLVKLVEFIEWNSIKQSDGFLIRMIRKENFYLKRQLSKFKALEKENVWREIDQVLENLLIQLQSSNSLRVASKQQAQKRIHQMGIKMKQVIANIMQNYK